jgi:LysR family transcriptional regulator, regulator of abg operon
VMRFHNHFPAATVRIVEGYPGALLPLVRDETLDFAMGPRVDARLDPGLAFRPLFRENFIVVGRRGHPQRAAGSLARLGAAGWVGGLWGVGAVTGPLKGAFHAAGLPPPRQVVQCESYNITLSVLEKSDMLGIIARRFLAYPPARDLLEEIPVTDDMPTLTIGLFTRKDPPLTPFAAAMAKAVASVARQLVQSA